MNFFNLWALREGVPEMDMKPLRTLTGIGPLVKALMGEFRGSNWEFPNLVVSNLVISGTF